MIQPFFCLTVQADRDTLDEVLVHISSSMDTYEDVKIWSKSMRIEADCLVCEGEAYRFSHASMICEIAERWPHAQVTCETRGSSCDSVEVWLDVWENGAHRLIEHVVTTDAFEESEGIMANRNIWFVRDGEFIENPYWETERDIDPDPEPDTILDEYILTFEDQGYGPDTAASQSATAADGSAAETAPSSDHCGQEPVKPPDKPGFIILPTAPASQPPKANPNPATDRPPVPDRPDSVIARHSRVELRNGIAEPIFENGKPTGKYRVCPKPHGWAEIAYTFRHDLPWKAIVDGLDGANDWLRQHGAK